MRLITTNGAVAGLLLWLSAPSLGQVCLRGDSNCDGLINNFDIDPFIIALLQPGEAPPADYLALATPGCWALRECWGDVRHDGLFNNFDIDPFVECILGQGGRSSEGCGLTRGVVVSRLAPASQRPYLLYMPVDYVPGNPVVVSLHGTDSTGALEMGPYGGAAWPDCGDPAWPELASDRTRYRAFAVICPDLYFNGNTASGPCNLSKDEQVIMDILGDLSLRGEISLAEVYITGWSSGSSAALTIGLRHSDLFRGIAVRYGPLDDLFTLDYTFDTIPACLDLEGECVWRNAQGGFWEEDRRWGRTCISPWQTWRENASMREPPILIINNQLEPYYWTVTQANIAAMAQLVPPFTSITQVVYESSGATAFECNLPLGAHEEARRAAADFLVRW